MEMANRIERIGHLQNHSGNKLQSVYSICREINLRRLKLTLLVAGGGVVFSLVKITMLKYYNCMHQFCEQRQKYSM